MATLGTILSAAYALWLYRKVIFGKLEKPSLFNIRDIGWREMVVLAPLVILTIVFGIYPKPVLDISAASVAQLIDNYQHALEPINPRRWRGEAMNAAAHMSDALSRCCRKSCSALGAMALLMLGAYRRRAHGARRSTALAIALLIAAGVIVLLLPAGKLVSFSGSFVVDNFARFLKILALAGSAAAIAMSLDYAKHERQQRFEYSVLIVLSTLGMMMLISAADLIALYLGLELMSLPLYVVAASHRDSLRSTEAGLKYFVLGALSSGMLLYGASLVYGFTGTVSFAGIAQAAAHGGIGLIFGLVFLFAGFCFKVSAVPFHMWTPDVYEGAPTPVTAFFAAAPKVAGIAMFVRAADRGVSRHHRRSGSRSSSSSPSPRCCSARSPRSASATSSG